MVRILLFISVFIGFVHEGESQFISLYGTSNYESSRSIVQGFDSSYILAGTTGSTSTSRDVIISKLNYQGEVQWTKKYGGSGDDEITDIIKTKDSCYIFVGYSTSSNWEGWMVKIDQSGSVLWSKKMGGSGNDFFRTIYQTQDSGFLIGGGFSSSGNYDAWFIKLNKNGGLEWTKTLGDNQTDYGMYAHELTSGNILFTFYSQSSSLGYGSFDWNLVKFGPDGSIMGQRRYGSSGDEGVRDFKPTKDGNYWIIGETSRYSIGKGMVIKVDTSGDQISRVLYQTSVNSHLDFYTGYPTADSGLIVAGYLGTDAVMIKLTKSLNVEWSKVYAPTGNQIIWNTRVVDDKSILSIGNSNETGGNGGQDILLIKSDSLGLFNCRNQHVNASIYTPATGHFNYSSVNFSSITAGGSVSNLSVSTQSFTLNRKLLNRDTDSIPLNLDGGQAKVFICNRDSVRLDATTKATYWDWSTGSDTSFTYASTPGVISVYARRNYCFNSDTAIVSYRDSAFLTNGYDTLLCQGQIFTFNGSGSGGLTSKYVFTWRDSSSNAVLAYGNSYVDTFFTNQTIKLSLWDSCGLYTDSVYYRIRMRSPLQVTAPMDTTSCSGELVRFRANATGGFISGSYSYNWLNGLSTADTLQISSDTGLTIHVVVSDACSMPDTAFFRLNVRPKISAVCNSDTVICIGQEARISVSATGGDSTYSYSWNYSLGQGNEKFIYPDSTSQFQVIVDDACSADDDTAVVTVFVRDELKVFPRTDTTVCQGELFPLYASGTGGYAPNYLFTWNNGIDTGRNQQIRLDTSTSLRIILSDACTDNSDTGFVNITVRDFLSVSLPQDTTICQGESIAIQATGTGGYSTSHLFSWNHALGTGSSKTVSPDTSTLYKVILSDNCSIRTDSAEIFIHTRPYISASIRSDTTLCRGQGVYLYSGASGGDTTYLFSWSHGLPGIQNPYVTPTHTTTYQVIIGDNCSEKTDTAFVTISVRDSLNVTLATDTTICVGESMVLRAESFGGLISGHQLIWDQGLSGSYSHLVEPDTTTTYQVILKDNCTLAQDTASVTITVRSPLQITPRSDTTLCIGQSVLLSATGNGGTPSTHFFTWDNGLGTGVSHSVSPDTTTVYQVILMDNCTTNPDTGEVIISVRPALEVAPRGDTTICDGEAVQLFAQYSGGYSPQHEITWNQGVGQGNYLSVSPSTSTRYEVILRDYCTTEPDTGFVTIIVRNPLTVLSRSDTTICIGQNVHLYAFGLGGDSSRYVFDWNQGIDTGRSLMIAPDTTTTYQVILSDFCTEIDDTSEVTIFVRPPLLVTERSDTFICVGEQVRLYADGDGGYAPTYSYSWDNGLDTGQANVVNPPVTNTYQVILKDQCTTDPDTGYVTVFVRKPLTLVRRPDTTVCIGEEVELYFDGTGGDSLHYTFVWNHDAGTGNYRKVSPDTTTTYHVQLTDNCTLESGKDSVTITLREPLSVEARLDSTLCIGEGIYLYSVYSGGHSPGYQLEWDQGIGVSEIPLVFPDTTTAYLVVLRDFCTVASDTDTVTIFVRPPLEITTRTDTMICIGENVSLFASAVGGYEPDYIFEWSHGLDTGQGNSVAPDLSTDYQVIVNDACTVLPDTGYVRVSVRDPLVVVPRMDTLICIGEQVGLYAEAGGGDSSYFFRWDQGTDTVDAPVVGPEITTIYEVIVRDNCTSKPDTGFVTVNVRPALNVRARLDTLMCRGESVLLGATASGGDSLAYEYEWDEGIGISPTAMVTPDSTQTFRVIVRDYCTTKSDTDFVTIYTRDALSIQPRSDTTICIGQSVQVYGVPGGGNNGTYAYTWNNGLSGLERHQVSPQTTTSYQVILDDNCTVINDTASFTITVRDPLDLTVRSDTFICQGESVVLYVSASGGDPNAYSYTWNQGVGTQVNPLVSPTQNTNYFVTLTDNCTSLGDSGSVNIILPMPLSITKSNDTLICRNDPVIVLVSGTGGIPGQYVFSWDKLGTGAKKTVRPNLTTWYAVQLDDQCALPVRDSIQVNVQVPLLPGFVFDPAWACVPNDIQFDDTTSGATDAWYNWEFGDGSSDTGLNLLRVNHSFGDVGTYPVRLILRSPLGCYDTSYYYDYEIHADPIASFKHEYEYVSGIDMSIRFINTTKGGQDYYWDFGDNTTEELVEDPVHAYAEARPYSILLIAVNEWGCVDSTFDTIDVKDVYRVFIPNAFTPGGSDTLNAVFGPMGTGIAHYDMQIYNRWGQLVYSTEMSEPWDGTGFEGDMVLPAGIYVYVMRVFSTRDIKKSFSGTIYLVR